MALWMSSITISIVLLTISAATRGSNVQMAYVHLAVSAMVAIVFAYLAIRDTRKLIDEGAGRAALAASFARSVGLVWAWGALAIAATYATGILAWREWLTFLIAFAVASGLSLFLAATFKKDAESGRDDETMHTVARYLTLAQLAGMIIVMLGLLIDGKMTRFLVPRHGDWAANNIFFFGAVAIAAISAYALQVNKRATKSSRPDHAAGPYRRSLPELADARRTSDALAGAERNGSDCRDGRVDQHRARHPDFPGGIWVFSGGDRFDHALGARVMGAAA